MKTMSKPSPLSPVPHMDVDAEDTGDVLVRKMNVRERWLEKRKATAEKKREEKNADHTDR